MGRPKRRTGLIAERRPAALAERLPSMLREFAPSIDPESFREHLHAIASMVGDHLAHPVMSHAGLSVADWYRQAFAQNAALESAERIHAPRAPTVSAEGQNIPGLRVVK